MQYKILDRYLVPIIGATDRKVKQTKSLTVWAKKFFFSEPSLTSIPTSPFSFSEACQRGNDHVTLSSAVAFPALSSSEAFPSLGSSYSTPSNSSGAYVSKQQSVDIRQNFDDPATVHNTTPGKGKKKKKKAKNLVLFSTGGSRGY
mmetsp:Transcript_37241/g.41646  ORF Transcript_37241/g.41646 Transcript_37241/m.41646 type:complete len:145 (-) Transcript_37241:2722-3156(-)